MRGRDILQRVRERIDDRPGRERIAVGFEVGTLEQETDAAVELLQLVVAEVLDDALQVPANDGLVHRGRLDQRQLAGCHRHRREFRLHFGAAGERIVDRPLQALLEVGEERRALRLQDPTRIEQHLLLLAHVGASRPVHQHVGDFRQNVRKRALEATNGQIPAIAEDLLRLARLRAPGRRVGRGRVQARSS